MDTLFENITTYTKEELLGFEKYHFNKVHKTTFLIYIIGCIIILISGVALVYISEKSGFIYLILGTFLLVYRLVIPYLFAKRILKGDKITENIENKYEFYEDSLKLTNKVSESNVRYEQLFKVYESKTCFYLYISKVQAFVVSKSSFNKGSSEEFSKFIETKVDKSFKKVF